MGNKLLTINATRCQVVQQSAFSDIANCDFFAVLGVNERAGVVANTLINHVSSLTLEPTEIVPGLYLGNAYNAANFSTLEYYNIKHIINISTELPNTFPNQFNYLQIRIKDDNQHHIYEYIPEIIEENGKKKKVMDEFGRVQYSQVPKTDKEGKVKWKIDSLDLEVFAKNVRKYGLWQEDLLTLKEAILAADVE